MSQPTRQAVRWATRACVVLLGVALLPLLAAPADAHAALEDSTPDDGATVHGGPEEIALTFTEPMSQPATIIVTGPNGEVVTDEAATVDGPRVRLSLDALPAVGTYQVTWRAVSADDHPVEGELAFEVTGTDVDDGDRDQEPPTPEPLPRHSAGATERSDNRARTDASHGGGGGSDGDRGDSDAGLAAFVATPEALGAGALLVGLLAGGALLGKRRQVRAGPARPDDAA